MKRYHGGTLLSKPFIYLKSHLFRVDKPTSYQSSSRLFWHKKNARANSQEVLLADIAKRCWGLCQKLKHLFDFKSSLI